MAVPVRAKIKMGMKEYFSIGISYCKVKILTVLKLKGLAGPLQAQ